MRTLMRTLLLSVLIVIVSNTLVFAAEGNPPIEQPGSQIGTNGGRIDQTTMPELKQYGLDNLSIEFPEGCVNQQVRLQVNLPTTIPAERAAIRAAEFIVEGHENGFAFNKPVTIAIPYPENVANETPLTLMYWNHTAGDWEPIDQPQSIVRDHAAHVVRAQVNHFSIYGVMETPNQYRWGTIGTNGGRIDQTTTPELKQFGLDNLSIECPEGCVNQQIRLQVNLPTIIPAERAAIRAVELLSRVMRMASPSISLLPLLFPIRRMWRMKHH